MTSLDRYFLVAVSCQTFFFRHGRKTPRGLERSGRFYVLGSIMFAHNSCIRLVSALTFSVMFFTVVAKSSEHSRRHAERRVELTRE